MWPDVAIYASDWWIHGADLRVPAIMKMYALY
jgi:hypothetical protein